ncbi:endoplasmic reticulum lectin 1 isoform X2 [Daktulosphaira vitifoliae]|uniref:endoplasmic reticulum lectin 1 isoform X2 n=1 Tax=Daktulosphaira vitifoliae TaxID=58002 RepID=UPI0021AA9FFF|nr:endoplasmic reticulum lectin 1 isoform X2 [Daktulosphaira vitifoliae]
MVVFRSILYIFVLLLVAFCQSQDFKGFDDTILYKINWPGKDAADLVTENEQNKLYVKSPLGESYQCILPQHDEENRESGSPYDGPSPLELLSPLFSKQACSYRVDTYWIYEVCHGKHVRQYHNEREEKSQKEQEYYLGKWTVFDSLKLEEELKRLTTFNYPGPTQTRKIEGINLPYFQMNMTDGTICDLNGRPRHTNVLYVCYPQSKHNVFSVKETSTCQYEVIVMTSLLCAHPWYKPSNNDELSIDCLPVGESPRKPHNLRVLQSDRSKLKKQLKVLTNGEAQIRVKLQPINSENEVKEKIKVKNNMIESHKRVTNEINEFFNSELCLDGGSGWWKYEICYKKHVRQVHKEKGKPDIVVNLGEFHMEEHIKWLERNPEKKAKSGSHKNYISHYYSFGSICEETGERRETEVRFKCINNRKPDYQVALYLLEPKTCKYILTVESSAICDFLLHADENNMLMSLEKKSINNNVLTIENTEKLVNTVIVNNEDTKIDDKKKKTESKEKPKIEL